jgi:CheY-like chemotaxis protein
MAHYFDATAPTETVREPGRDGSLSSDPGPPYVLVVDDESMVRAFLTRCLEDWGYAVKQAGSAAEALEMMVAKPASLVLCDVKMPGNDGVWLAERLRAHWPQTQVVMVSANEDLRAVRESAALGSVDYITKPIIPEQLRQAVRRAATPIEEGIVASEVVAPPPAPRPAAFQTGVEKRFEAEYTLESPVRCPVCGEQISSVKAVRLLRSKVNFTSTLPRRGRVVACPQCLAVIPAELSNF